MNRSLDMWHGHSKLRWYVCLEERWDWTDAGTSSDCSRKAVSHTRCSGREAARCSLRSWTWYSLATTSVDRVSACSVPAAMTRWLAIRVWIFLKHSDATLYATDAWTGSQWNSRSRSSGLRRESRSLRMPTSKTTHSKRVCALNIIIIRTAASRTRCVKMQVTWFSLSDTWVTGRYVMWTSSMRVETDRIALLSSYFM